MSTLRRILLIQGKGVRSTLVELLTSQGYDVLVVDMDDAGRAMAKAPDVVILELDVPHFDSMSAVQVIRANSGAPLIVAALPTDDENVAALLNAGAEDFVSKPISGAYLAARINVLLRRPTPPAGDTIVLGELKIDVRLRLAWLGQRRLDLTKLEFDLLAYLGQHAEQVVTRREILENVWQRSADGRNGSSDYQTIDVHVSWLRRKLGETGAAPRYLYTVRGVGLKLCAPAGAPTEA